MKNVIIILALLLVGCRAPKSIATATSVEVADQTQVDVEQTHEKTEQSSTITTTITEEGSVTVEETTTITYDTEKPVDTITGKPPVKSETNTKKTTTTGKQVNEQQQSESGTKEVDELKDKTKNDVEVVAEGSIKEKSQKPKVAYVFYILGLLVVVVAGYFLNRKFKWASSIFK